MSSLTLTVDGLTCASCAARIEKRLHRIDVVLAQANLGLAMSTGTDVAIEASDLTLVIGDLRAAADAIRLSRATLRTIRGNLFWAFA